MAPIRFENTIDIGDDRARVFAYLADIEHTPEWNWAIASSQKLTPGPVEVGTRFRLERTAPQRSVEELEVTSLQPGDRLEVAGRLGPFDARISYELSDVPSGTRIVNSVELKPTTSLGFLGGLVGGRIRSAVAENLTALKGVLEGDAQRHDRDIPAQ
ncbi:MAG TPA: SRPBCC family protein [Candidatus Limnocylindrales bacterium]|nr:SRPBCC family protein [Candidatus Limnocylindrales bacterium]